MNHIRYKNHKKNNNNNNNNSSIKVNISNWDTSSVTNMQQMFQGATAFQQDISSWTGTAATTAQTNMFFGATAFQTRFMCTDAVTGPSDSCACTRCIADTSFYDFVETCLAEAPADGECTAWASDKTYGTMPNWDTYLVTNMNSVFDYEYTFNGDISNWDTSQVTDMYAMFNRAFAFNRDIGSWNTAQVTNMRYMFVYASAFNQDIGRWNTEKVTDTLGMFNNARAFNQDIGSWNTSQVTTMQVMFYHAFAFNHDIGRLLERVTKGEKLTLSSCEESETIDNIETHVVRYQQKR